jgi:hypothetical protein
MSDPQKSNFDLVPAELRASGRWVLWRLQDEGERKRQKVPYQARNPSRKASHSNPATWATYEEAVGALLTLRAAPEYKHDPNCKGIGLVIGPPFVPVDLDKCRNLETGEVEPWAQEFINELNSYTELSPSGKGYHVWLRGFPLKDGQQEKNGAKRDDVEVYAGDRYFTVTGQHVEGTPTELRRLTQAESNALFRKVMAGRKPAILDARQGIPSPGSAPNMVLSPKYSALKEGNIEAAGFTDPSAAVQSFLTYSAYYHLCDRKEVEADFKSSGLYRDFGPGHGNWIEKWERLRDSELEKACGHARQWILDRLRGKKAPELHAPLVVSTARSFLTEKFRNREPLIATATHGFPVFHIASVNQVHAWRGVGKTNFCLDLGNAMARGTGFLAWKAPRAFSVLYIEGELPGQELQERIKQLVGESDNFMVVTPEAQPSSMIPRIATEEGRRLVEEAIVANLAEVVFLDSISTLANIPANDEEEWLAILDWFKNLRNRYGIALFYLQHDGKQGLQRGHSKHEDILDKSVQTWPRGCMGINGLNFRLQFDKARQPVRESANLLVELLEHMGHTEWICGAEIDKKAKVLELVAAQTPVREITKQVKVSSKTIAKWKREQDDAEQSPTVEGAHENTDDEETPF